MEALKKTFYVNINVNNVSCLSVIRQYTILSSSSSFAINIDTTFLQEMHFVKFIFLLLKKFSESFYKCNFLIFTSQTYSPPCILKIHPSLLPFIVFFYCITSCSLHSSSHFVYFSFL